MKIIEQSAEIIQPTGYDLDSIYQDIERAARTSYKSTPKGDAKGFVDRLISSGHYSPLEFGTVYMHIKNDTEAAYEIAKYVGNSYTHIVDNLTDTYITTNMRVIVEHHWEDDLKYMCAPTEHHVKRYTLHCITSIGVTRELNRHKVVCVA